jgi:hypothetical protein
MQAVPLQAKALRGERRAAWTSICLTMTRRGVPNSFRGCGCAEMGCAGRVKRPCSLCCDAQTVHGHFPMIVYR